MAPKPVRASRNKELVRGTGRNGRSKTYHKRGLWAIKAKNGGTFPTHQKSAAAEASAVRAPKFYPADVVKKPLHKNKVVNAPKLRSSISPETVGWSLQGQACGVPEAVGIGASFGDCNCKQVLPGREQSMKPRVPIRLERQSRVILKVEVQIRKSNTDEGIDIGRHVTRRSQSAVVPTVESVQVEE